MFASLNAYVCDIPIMDISVRQPRDLQIETVYNLGVKTAALLRDRHLSRDKIVLDDRYVGPGFETPTQGTLGAPNWVVLGGDILLDPVYPGKGMAGFIGQISKGQIA